MNTSMRNGLLAIGLLVIIGIAGGAYLQFWNTPEETAQVPEGQVAGEANYDAVPDGTPETAEIKLGETKIIMGASITPQEVVEDSRCPEGVQCIQAGTVRVGAQVIERGGSAAEPVVFELGVPMTLGMDQITLVAVDPAPQEGAQIASGDYTFTFTVTKGAGTELFKG